MYLLFSNLQLHFITTLQLRENVKCIHKYMKLGLYWPEQETYVYVQNLCAKLSLWLIWFLFILIPEWNSSICFLYLWQNKLPCFYFWIARKIHQPCFIFKQRAISKSISINQTVRKEITLKGLSVCCEFVCTIIKGEIKSYCLNVKVFLV